MFTVALTCVLVWLGAIMLTVIVIKESVEWLGENLVWSMKHWWRNRE